MLELFWLGQAGFRLRDPLNATTVFCDPFLSPNPNRSWAAPIEPAALAEAEVILVSHEHSDHFDRGALEAAAAAPGSRFTIILPEPLADTAVGLGIPPQRVIGAQPGRAITQRGVNVHPLPARHGVNMSDAYTFGDELSNGLIRYLGYVIELGGTRVYHAGDCIPYAGQADRLKELRPNVVLLPINGRDFFRESERNIVGNMDFREAARLANDAGAEILIPMHWELFSGNRGYPGDLVGFATDNFPQLSILVLGRGQRATIQAATG